MQRNFCDQEDCLLHPTYIKKEEERLKREAQIKEAKAEKERIKEINSIRVITDQDLTANLTNGTYVYSPSNGMATQNHGHFVTMGGGSTTWSAATYDHSVSWDSSLINGQVMRIKTSTIDIPFECTICSHFKKLDMKEILIIEEAKKALND